MADLAGLTRTYLREWFLDNGAFATLLGAEGYNRVLGDFSAAAFERRERRSRHWLDTFAGLGDAGLSLDDRVDRDVMLAHLRGEAVAAELPAWRRDPSLYLTHCQLGVISLFGHRPHAEPELVAAAVSRLRQIPKVLDHARRNLDGDLAAPMVVRRSAAMAAGGLRLVRAVVLTEVADPTLRRRLVEPGLAAGQAFADFARWLIAFADRARGDWQLGERRYTALLRDRDLLDVDAAALCDRGRTACDALDEQLREVAARVPGGSADWRTVMTRARADHPATPEAMRAEYEAVTTRARNFLVDHDLVSFGEGEQCQVVPAPPFSRMTDQIASYLNLPVLSGRRTGRLYVPYPPDGATPEVVEQRLRANSRVAMPTVVAHDVYPGHHWHRSWLVGSRRPVRIVFGNAFFGEGWSLYGEHMMRQHGFFADPAEELAHLEARIFRAARIVVDTSLHCGEMGTDEAVAFLASRAPSWADVAGPEVARYCAMPTHAASYLAGALEIERIRDRWRKQNPDAPLREFHDRLAGAGELPLGLAERLALGG